MKLADADEIQGTLRKLLVQSTETNTTVKQIDERTRRHSNVLYGPNGGDGIVHKVHYLTEKQKEREEVNKGDKTKKTAMMLSLWGAAIAGVGTMFKKIWDNLHWSP